MNDAIDLLAAYHQVPTVITSLNEAIGYLFTSLKDPLPYMAMIQKQSAQVIEAGGKPDFHQLVKYALLHATDKTYASQKLFKDHYTHLMAGGYAEVRLIRITPDAEALMAYIGRVSSDWQDNPEYGRLFDYLLREKHWSPFEHAYATMEIVTGRDVSAQIIRHRSFSFQEFSQRYQNVTAFGEQPFDPVREVRAQGKKNRQATTELVDGETSEWWTQESSRVQNDALSLYLQGLDRGIARDTARRVLPLATKTRLYMTGTIRSWIHFLDSRNHPHTQREHQFIAKAIQCLLGLHLPEIATDLGWSENLGV